MNYAVVIEKSLIGYAAYVPDLPGCVATAATVEACKSEIANAVKFHIEGLKEDGLSIPEPTTVADYIAA